LLRKITVPCRVKLGSGGALVAAFAMFCFMAWITAHLAITFIRVGYDLAVTAAPKKDAITPPALTRATTRR
jgi:hypothetical protein